MKKRDWTFYLLLAIAVPWPFCQVIAMVAAAAGRAGGEPAQELAALQLEQTFIPIAVIFAVASFGGMIFMALFSREKPGTRAIGALLFFLGICFWLNLLPFPPDRRRYQVAACGVNLRSLHTALIAYADDSNRNLPPDLETLVRLKYPVTPDALRCPGVHTRQENISDYRYSGAGRKIDEKPPFPLLEDLPDNHPGMFRNQLTSDGVIRNIGK